MTDPLFMPQSQSPRLALFHLDPTQPQPRLLAEAPTPAIIAAALGLPALPPGSAEVIRLADVAALGLREYLTQAHDVMPDATEADRPALDALEGHVLIVRPTVAQDGAVTLHPAPGLRLQGVWPVGTPMQTPLHLPDAPRSADKRHATATPLRRGSGRAVLVLLVVVAIVVVLAVLGLRA